MAEGQALRAKCRERLRIAVAEIQGLSVLKGIKGVLCASNQSFESVERDALDKLSHENRVICIAMEDVRDDMFFVIKPLYTETIANQTDATRVRQPFWKRSIGA